MGLPRTAIRSAGKAPAFARRRRRRPSFRSMPAARWSYRSSASLGSAASIGSVASFLSLGSVASFGSILSVGSSGSILSVGSAGSVLSIGSAGAVLSIGSSGSVLAVGSSGAGAGACGESRPAAGVTRLATLAGLGALVAVVAGR